MMWLSGGEKHFDNTFSRFDREQDGRTEKYFATA